MRVSLCPLTPRPHQPTAAPHSSIRQLPPYRPSPARDPALDSRVDRQLSSSLLSLASYINLHRIFSWLLQRLGIARYLDRLLGSPPLPRTPVAPKRPGARTKGSLNFTMLHLRNSPFRTLHLIT